MELHGTEQFIEAVRLFNEREFFACHDVLEEVWSQTLDDERDFLQGLIHAAVALFHFGEGNLAGARKVHDSAIRYLAGYGDSHAGIDLGRFRADFDVCFEPLLGAHHHYPQGVVLNHELIPMLRPVE
jgi:predicted metal-dependent hydrolase